MSLMWTRDNIKKIFHKGIEDMNLHKDNDVYTDKKGVIHYKGQNFMKVLNVIYCRGDYNIEIARNFTVMYNSSPNKVFSNLNEALDYVIDKTRGYSAPDNRPRIVIDNESPIAWVYNKECFTYGKYSISKPVRTPFTNTEFDYVFSEKGDGILQHNLFYGTQKQCFEYAEQYFNNPNNKTKTRPVINFESTLVKRG